MPCLMQTVSIPVVNGDPYSSRVKSSGIIICILELGGMGA